MNFKLTKQLLHSFIIILILCNPILITGCIGRKGIKPGTVQIQSIPLKIVLASTGAAINVVIEEFSGIKIDTTKLLEQIFIGKVSEEIPSKDVPVLKIINKKTNKIYYWELSENVEQIDLSYKYQQPGEITLRVKNKEPLHIELWIDDDIESIKLDVKFKD